MANAAAAETEQAKQAEREHPGHPCSCANPLCTNGTKCPPDVANVIADLAAQFGEAIFKAEETLTDVLRAHGMGAEIGGGDFVPMLPIWYAALGPLHDSVKAELLFAGIREACRG